MKVLKTNKEILMINRANLKDNNKKAKEQNNKIQIVMHHLYKVKTNNQ
jgi:hypothetical protein